MHVSDGARIAFTVLDGAREVPVLFVNGWTCTDAYWERIVERIVAAGYPAVLFDVRGHGESDLPRRSGFAARHLRPEDVAVERLARDVVEVLGAAGFADGVLVGHSMGVQLAIEAYRIEPARVAAIVAVAGAFENPLRTFAGTTLFDRLFPVAELLSRAIPLEALRPVLRRIATPRLGRLAAGLVGAAGPDATVEDMAPHMRQIGDLDFSVLVRMLAALRGHRAAAFLPEIRVPMLVLAGTRDVFTPMPVQRQLAAAVPGAEIVWFPGAGHLLPVEDADGVADAMLDFLARRLS